MQRGVLTETHATFPVFRQSFVHLSEGQDLYAAYPTEQGSEDRDRFKYSPSAALFFAPFAFLPIVVGLFLWTALNSLGLYAAVKRLIPGRDAPWALLIVFPALIAAIQSTSSNALVAALMIGAFVALEQRSAVGAAGAIVSGTLMKLYPAAAASFVLTHPKRWRTIGIFLGVAALFLVAPLLVVSPAELAVQYRTWVAVLLADGQDLTFARSIMVVVREWTGSDIGNFAIQGPATLLLLAPIVGRPAAMTGAAYRRMVLASILIYVVIFNHQAENASYVIAAVGLAVWFLASPRTPARVALLILCMAGLEAVPYALVWLWMQFDLLEGERLVATLRTRFTLPTLPALRRLGVVAGVGSVATLAIWPRVSPNMQLNGPPPAYPQRSLAATSPTRGADHRRRVPTLRPASVLIPVGSVFHEAALLSLPEPKAAPIPAPTIIGLPGTGARIIASVALADTPVRPWALSNPCTIDTLGTAVPGAWLSTRVGKIRIEPGGVDLPSERLSAVARRLHVPTSADVVRQELSFRSGEVMDTSRMLESVRRLRESSLFTDVVIEGRHCGQDANTDIAVRTRDAWSTRGSIRLGGRAPMQAWLIERNILGSGRTVSLGSEESNGHQVMSAAVADPRFLGAPVLASASLRLHGDGREWAWSVRTRERSPRDDWRATLASTQIRRKSIDSKKGAVTDIARRSNVLAVTRRVASSDAGVWAVTSGIENELSNLDVTRSNTALGGSRAHRAFTAPLVGVARRSTTYRAIDWLVPGQRASELRVGAEGDLAVSFGRETVAGGSISHWDGWAGITALPNPGLIVSADVWSSGYRVRDSVQNASVRATATVVARAKHGLWIGRLSAERVWTPDPDVFALSSTDPMLRTLSPTSRLAAQALSAQAERTAPLYARDGRWAIDGAVFGIWSRRTHTLDVAGNPMRTMQAAMVGVGLRQVRSDPRLSPLRLDIGRTVMSPRGLPNRWIVMLSASPSLSGGRARDGLRAPGR